MIFSNIGDCVAQSRFQPVIDARCEFFDNLTVNPQIFRFQPEPIEARRQFEQGIIATFTDIADDRPNARHNFITQSVAAGEYAAQLFAFIERIVIDSDNFDHYITRDNFAISALTSTRLRWKLARLTIRRAVDLLITSITSSPFSFKVRPVSTRSTIRSDNPSSGASSTEPESATTSIGTPFA